MYSNRRLWEYQISAVVHVEPMVSLVTGVEIREKYFPSSYCV